MCLREVLKLSSSRLLDQSFNLVSVSLSIKWEGSTEKNRLTLLIYFNILKKYWWKWMIFIFTVNRTFCERRVRLGIVSKCLSWCVTPQLCEVEFCIIVTWECLENITRIYPKSCTEKGKVKLYYCRICWNIILHYDVKCPEENPLWWALF